MMEETIRNVKRMFRKGLYGTCLVTSLFSAHNAGFYRAYIREATQEVRELAALQNSINDARDHVSHDRGYAPDEGYARALDLKLEGFQKAYDERVKGNKELDQKVRDYKFHLDMSMLGLFGVIVPLVGAGLVRRNQKIEDSLEIKNDRERKA